MSKKFSIVRTKIDERLRKENILMGCKYPENSRSYKSCALCSDKNICEESTNINNATTLLSASEAHRKTVDNIKNCSIISWSVLPFSLKVSLTIKLTS